MENNKRLEELKEQYRKMTWQMIMLGEESQEVVRQIIKLQEGEKTNV